MSTKNRANNTNLPCTNLLVSFETVGTVRKSDSLHGWHITVVRFDGSSGDAIVR